MIGNSNDETNFPHKLLLADIQVSKILKAYKFFVRMACHS